MIDILDNLSRKVRGRLIVAGDFNSRNTMWDTRNNAKGIALRRWMSKNSWKIEAPRESTFNSKQGSSVVDLLIYRGCSVLDTRVVEGEWQGCSDHLPVCPTVVTDCYDSRRSGGTISKPRRKNEQLVSKASLVYDKELPALLKRLQYVKTERDLNEIYRNTTELLAQPFRPKGRPHRSRAARPFWNHELEEMSKHRSKLHRRALRQTSSTAWDEYTEADRKLKRIARSLK